MSKPQSQRSLFTWVLAAFGIGSWALGTMDWLPSGSSHPLAYLLLIAAAVVADPLSGRSSASNLQLVYTIVAWLMVALISVTEALPVGGIVFFCLLSLCMTTMYFHPSFRLKTRVTLYILLLLLVWAPVMFGMFSPSTADSFFGIGSNAAFLGIAILGSVLFVGFTYRWLATEKAGP